MESIKKKELVLEINNSVRLQEKYLESDNIEEFMIESDNFHDILLDMQIIRDYIMLLKT